jgi:hypothetical protein
LLSSRSLCWNREFSHQKEEKEFVHMMYFTTGMHLLIIHLLTTTTTTTVSEPEHTQCTIIREVTTTSEEILLDDGGGEAERSPTNYKWFLACISAGRTQRSSMKYFLYSWQFWETMGGVDDVPWEIVK